MPENTEETTETTETESSTENTENETNTGAADQSASDDLDTLRSQLKEARSEAAKYRVNARETREALEKAKTPEEFEAVSARVSQLEADLSKARLAAKYNLPEALANRIAGDTDEAREEDAKSLAAFTAPREEIGKGGLSPNEKPEGKHDPKSLASLISRGRH